MVNIITDSTADLGAELMASRNIQVVPLYVYMNDQVYTDGVNINLPMLFQSVQATGQLPKTSAPTMLDFQNAFSQPGESVYIGLSSKLSATIQNATLAQQSLEPGKAFVIDARNVSTGIGLLVLRAADLRDQGCSAEEIYRQVSELVPKAHTSLFIDTLDYLYKGGRCSAVQNLMGGLLHIRPVIAVRPDGSLGIKSKIRGSREKCLRALLDEFQENLPQIDLTRVFVTHTLCDSDAVYLKQEILKIAPTCEVIITYAGSVIASHCGPGTIGILYLLK